MRSRFAMLAVLTALSSLAGGEAAAANTDLVPTYVLDTIDGYHGLSSTSGGSFYVTGVVHGQSAATTLQIDVYSAENAQSCERAFIQSINRPGRFTVNLYSASCGITRNP